ncbi:hypothetical protein SAMD00019534_043810, partial [Acytostelium subglobosum LB1]|uniref:hypothetical protein n=1 Tax=Acytostelium subglobosum LB1 TaxID=1410327 RepID=UPI000644CDDE
MISSIKKVLLTLAMLMLVLNVASAWSNPVPRRREMQESMFRLITSVGYRTAQDSTEWCGEERTKGGRPYEWSKYRGMSVYLLDLYLALQFDPACNDNINALRTMFIDTPTLPSSYNANSTWWKTVFFPKSLDAFTCGFTGSKLSDFEFVSEDLSANFDSDFTKQKLWYLIEDYMLGQYKQRENPNRRLDFDAGLYIPFIDHITGGIYTTQHMLRVGFPTFMGRSLWFLLHSLAYRVQEIPAISPTSMEDINNRMTIFITYFAYNHPCPFCREHFISHVSVNDRYARDLVENEAIRFYPIDHLLMSIDGTLSGKLSTIVATDKTSASKFFWKLHNAVTSSVEQGCVCMTQEGLDVAPFNCIFDSTKTRQKSYPMFQRIYPTAMRFEFILTDDHNKTMFFDSRNAMRDIELAISKVDSLELRKELFRYWARDIPLTTGTLMKVANLTTMINEMSNIFIKTPILKQQYSMGTPVIGADLEAFLGTSNTRSQIPTPIGMITKLPQVCKAEHEKNLSACMKAYVH